MSEAHRGKTPSPATRARMSEAQKGKTRSPATRARMSEARKRALSDPEVRARVSEAQKRRHLGAPKDIEVPGWVRRAGLVDDFLEAAAGGDEFAPARHCRGLIREMGQ